MSLSPENQKIIDAKNDSRALSISLAKRSEKIGNLLWRTTRKAKYSVDRIVTPNVIGVFRNFGRSTKGKKNKLIMGGVIEDNV